MPLVSVLLPVYNAVHDLPRVLSTLRNQTLNDYEIIAIDDGSTDGSSNLLDKYSLQDNRIRVFHQENAGALGKVLNKAAEEAQGKYLARQDADDASALNRLEEQVHYLETHPGTGICGTWSWHIESELGPLFSSELPDKHSLLYGFLEKGMNPYIHGSVMLRADLFRKMGGYRGSLVEDFDLWLRISEKTNLGMLEKTGYYYWHSPGGISSGAHLRQARLVKLSLKLHRERLQFGREVTEWESQYQGIMKLPVNETSQEERLTSMHYAHGIHMMRLGIWNAARDELILASQGEGQYAKKAKRNLTFFRFAPIVGFVYSLRQTRETRHYARNLPPGTPLPEFLMESTHKFSKNKND